MASVQFSRREFTAGAAAGMAALTLGLESSHAGDAVGVGLRAGAAEAVVSPDAEGTFLIGPMQASSGVNDDLFARALVLDDGRLRLAIITLDYLGFDFEYNDRLVQAVAEAGKIQPQHVMINASHNHSAPLTIPWGPWEKKKDKPWHESLPKKLAEITRQAAGQLAPVKLRFNREPTQISFNRRLRVDDGSVTMAPNPHGPQMPWVDVLTIDRVVGDRIGALFSYAAHPVIVHGASRKISADFPGFAMQHLYEMATSKRVFMFAQGCSGNINGFPLRGGIGAAHAAGRDLGYAVARAIRGGGGDLDSQRLKAAVLDLELPLQSPPPVAKCREMAAKSPDDQQLQELLAIAERGKPQFMPFPMRAFAIGDELCIVSMPHEIFSQYQLYAEQISPFRHNIVLAYTNGCECYVGMKKDYQQGPGSGYETSPMGASLLYHRRVGLAPEAEDIIRDGIEKILRKVSSA